VSSEALEETSKLTFVPIDYLPDFSRLVTAQHIFDGTKPISMRQHIKDILQHYDVVQVPRSFLGSEVRLPEQGRFFMVQAENPNLFWAMQNRAQHLEFFGGASQYLQ
jgi:hypothetical protein